MPADAIGYKYMEVGREAKRENTNSISRASAHGGILENYRLENLLYGFLA